MKRLFLLLTTALLLVPVDVNRVVIAQPSPADTTALTTLPTPKADPIKILVPADIVPGEDYDIPVMGLSVNDLVPGKVLFLPPESSSARVKLVVQWSLAGLEPVIIFRAKAPGNYRLVIVKSLPNEQLMAAVAVVTVKGDVTPPDPPPPEPVVNPYQPDPTFKAVVAPVTKYSLSPADSQNLSKLYGVAARQALAQLTTTVELRAFLISEGAKLNLKDKYKGLGTEIDSALIKMLGSNVGNLDKTVAGKALDTLAWAVWETGKAGRK